MDGINPYVDRRQIQSQINQSIEEMKTGVPKTNYNWEQAPDEYKVFSETRKYYDPDLMRDLQDTDYYKQIIQQADDPEEVTNKLANSMFLADVLKVDPSTVFQNYDKYATHYFGNPNVGQNKKILENAWDIGWANVEIGHLGMKWLMNQATEADFQRLELLQTTLPDIDKMKQSLPEKILSLVGEQIPLQLDSFNKAAPAALITGTTTAGMTALAGNAGPQALAPEEIITVPLAFTWGFGKMYTAMTVKNIGEIEAGQAFVAMMQIEGENGEKIDRKTATALSLGVGVLNGLLEMSQIDTMLDTIPGFKDIFKVGMRKAVTNTFTSNGFKAMAKNALSTIGKTMVSETAQELLQESVSMTAEELAKQIQEMEINYVEGAGDTHDAAMEYMKQEKIDNLKMIEHPDVLRERRDGKYNMMEPTQRDYDEWEETQKLIASYESELKEVKEARQVFFRESTKDVMDRYWETAIAAAITSGVLSAPGSMVTAIQTNRKAKAEINGLIREAIAWGDFEGGQVNIESVVNWMQEDERWQKYAGINQDLYVDFVKNRMAEKQGLSGDIQTVDEKDAIRTELNADIEIDLDSAKEEYGYLVESGVFESDERFEKVPTFDEFVEMKKREISAIEWTNELNAQQHSGDITGMKGNFWEQHVDSMTEPLNDIKYWMEELDESPAKSMMQETVMKLEESIQETVVDDSTALDIIDEYKQLEESGLENLPPWDEFLNQKLDGKSEKISEFLGNISTEAQEAQREVRNIQQELSGLDTVKDSGKIKGLYQNLEKALVGRDLAIANIQGSKKAFKEIAYSQINAIRQQEKDLNNIQAIMDIKSIMATPEYQQNLEKGQVGADIENFVEHYREEYAGKDLDQLNQEDLEGLLQYYHENVHSQAIKIGQEHQWNKFRIANARKSIKSSAAETRKKYLSQIMRNVPKNVHPKQRRIINNIQKLINPVYQRKSTFNVRNELINEWVKDPGSMTKEEIRDLVRKPLNDFTIGDIRQIRDQVHMLTTIGQMENKIENAKFNAKKTIMKTSILTNAKIGIDELNKVGWNTEEGKKLRKTKGRAWKAVEAKSYTPAVLVDKLEGGRHYKGEMHKMMITDRNQNNANELRVYHDRIDSMKKFRKENHVNLDTLLKKQEISGRVYTNEQILGMYIGMKEETTEAILKYGNFKEVRPKQAVAWINEFISKAQKESPEIFKMADKIIEDFRDNHARIAAVYEQMTHQEFGFYSVYMPVMREWVNTEFEDTEIQAEQRTEYMKHIMQELTFRKDITAAATQNPLNAEKYKRIKVKEEFQTPMRLDLFSIWMETVEKQEHFIANAEQTLLMRSVFADGEVKKVVEVNYGKDLLDGINSYINAVVNPHGHKSQDFFNRASRMLRGNYSKAYLAASTTVVAKQAVSLMFYIPKAGMRNIAGSSLRYIFDHKNMKKELYEADPALKYRMAEIESAEYKKHLQHSIFRATGKASKGLMAGIQMFDRIAVMIGSDAMIKNLKDQGISPSDAISQTRDFTNRTQPNSDPATLAAMFRSSKDIVNWFLMFTQQTSKIWQMMTYDMKSEWKHDKGSFFKMNAVLAINFMVMAMISERKVPDAEEVPYWLASQSIDKVPIVGRMVAGSMRGYTNNELPMFGPATALGRSILAFGSSGKNREDQINNSLKNLAYELGAAAGLPTTATKRVIKSIEEENAEHFFFGGELGEEKDGTTSTVEF